MLFFIWVKLTFYLFTLESQSLVYWDVIFHLDPIEYFVKLKKITRNHDRLRSSESYDPTDPERLQRSLNDPDCFGQVES